MPLWCRLRLTWSTFRFRSRDACMTKLGIMTDENTTSQQTQPTEAATEAAARDCNRHGRPAAGPRRAVRSRVRRSGGFRTADRYIRASAPFHRPGRTVRIRPSAVGLTVPIRRAFSRATALLEAVAGNPHTPVADRVFLADTMPFPNVLVKLSEDPEPSVRQAVAANGDDKNWLVGRLTKDPVPAVRGYGVEKQAHQLEDAA